MLLVALVIVRQNPFEPTSLFFSEPFIDQGWLVIDNELFATAVTPKGSHFLQTHCFLLALTLLYRNCTHLRNVSCLWQRACLVAALLHLMLKQPSPVSYLTAATDFTEMVSPLAVPVTVACSQANLLSSSNEA